MKKHQTSHFSVAVITATVVMLFIVTTVYAAPKNYYGLTTVTYDNSISDQGSGYWGWNANYNDTTNPSRSMDQFGVNFWSAWCS
jgi:hypothetical protein